MDTKVKALLGKIRKKPKLAAVLVLGVAALFCAPTMLHNKFSSERAEKERGFALSAIEETLKLSKAIEGFYEANDNQTAIIQSKGRFSEISSNLKSLSDAKAGSQFISTVRKASDFFSSYCDHHIDVLNKTEAMKLDLSINDHVDAEKVERLLSEKSKFGTQANQVQNEVLRSIPKAFSDWEQVLSPEDCHTVFGFIDENFAAEKKKMSGQKDKKGGPELQLHEWIAMQINEHVFDRWMAKEMGDLIDRVSAKDKGN
jgi:hypothetical protein